ncbi:hypothetical protein, partial [Pseudomonas aeruginosa]|uniref:hypothetical protein n=1 Tax=Pseudomonas aeruginosa TaxID=287 RepID=UPI001A9EFA91
MKLFSIKALLGEAKNSLAILMGRTLKIAQLFAHRLQKVAHSLGASCALSRSPLGICSLAFYPQRYQPKS